MNEEEIRRIIRRLTLDLTQMGREIASLRREVEACRDELRGARRGPGTASDHYEELFQLFRTGTMSMDTILAMVGDSIQQPLTTRPLTGFTVLPPKDGPPASLEPASPRLRYDRDDPV